MKFDYSELNDFKEKNFNSIFTNVVTIGHEHAQRCIVAMVNSGDYTLEQAIYVFGHCCERCMNVLLHKYLNGEDGYAEYSEEWQNTNTKCKFCDTSINVSEMLEN